MNNDCLSSSDQRTSLNLQHLHPCQPREINICSFKTGMCLSVLMACIFLLCGTLPNLSVISHNPEVISTIKGFIYMCVCMCKHIHTCHNQKTKSKVSQYQFDLGKAEVQDWSVLRVWHVLLYCLQPVSDLVKGYSLLQAKNQTIRNLLPNLRDFISASAGGQRYPTTAFPLALFPPVLSLSCGCYNESLLSTRQHYVNVTQLSPATRTGLLRA